MSDKLEALKAKKPTDTKSLKSQAAGYVTDDNSGGYYVVECQECGEVYPSQECDGGGPIADTGDYNDALCPRCGCESPDECSDTPLVWNVQQAKINALLAALEEKDQSIKELEQRLQQPIKLPPLMPENIFGGTPQAHMVANSHNNAITACSMSIRDAGFKSECTVWDAAKVEGE